MRGGVSARTHAPFFLLDEKSASGFGFGFGFFGRGYRGFFLRGWLASKQASENERARENEI